MTITINKYNKFSIVIPVYETHLNTKKLFDSFSKYLNEFIVELIFVVDLPTKEFLLKVKSFKQKNIKVILIINDKKVGYGKALQMGILKASHEKIYTMDVDNQHKIQDIIKLNNVFNNNPNLIFLIGQRTIENNIIRNFAKKFIKYLNFFVSGSYIIDSLSGMKGYRSTYIKKIINEFKLPNGMAFSDIISNIYFIFFRNKIKEVPINVRNRNFGESKVQKRDFFIIIFNIIILNSKYNSLILNSYLIVILAFLKVGIIFYLLPVLFFLMTTMLRIKLNRIINI